MYDICLTLLFHCLFSSSLLLVVVVHLVHLSCPKHNLNFTPSLPSHAGQVKRYYHNIVKQQDVQSVSKCRWSLLCTFGSKLGRHVDLESMHGDV